MALIVCPECGKECSNQATSCPHCGAPIVGQPMQSYPRTAVSDELSEEELQQQKKKRNAIIGVVFGAIIGPLIGLLVAPLIQKLMMG